MVAAIAVIALAPVPAVRDVFANGTRDVIPSLPPSSAVAASSLDWRAPHAGVDVALASLEPVAAQQALSSSPAAVTEARLRKVKSRVKVRTLSTAALQPTLSEGSQLVTVPEKATVERAAVEISERNEKRGAVRSLPKLSLLKLPPLSTRLPPSQPSNPTRPGAAPPDDAEAQAPALPLSWSKQEIEVAKAECVTLLKDANVSWVPQEPLREGACGMAAPIALTRAGEPAVDIKPAAIINCQAAASFGRWISESVQPAAQEIFKSPVVKLLSASSYACRNRYGQQQAPLSEHALGNAIDIAGFVLADGKVIKLVDGWGPVTRDATRQTVALATDEKAKFPKPSHLGASGLKPKGTLSARGTTQSISDAAAPVTGQGDAKSRFLKRVHAQACGMFGTVLGPEANDAHRDHLHLDMKVRKRTAYCQ